LDIGGACSLLRTYERAADWFRRYGVWSLHLSWLPVIGDPLEPFLIMLHRILRRRSSWRIRPA
jgi:hypothetical protein